ncbi:NAD(P)-binding protein [Nemania diffusa]|nr:NAD(P)-binding protein [Nemania diffusa]
MSQLKGTILVTGANGGLGNAIVSQLVSNPELEAHYGIFTVRNTEAAAALESTIGHPVSQGGFESHEVISLDLSRLSSVREVAATINARVASGAIPPISALILSAGYQESGKQTWNEDGLDMSFVVNYLSQWLLTLRLLQSMDSRRGRVVWISSWAQDPQDRHNVMNGSFNDPQFKTIIADDLEMLATGTWSSNKDDKTSWAAGYRRYGASKLCAVAMIHELQRRLDQDPLLSGISVLAVDPGAMATGIVRHTSWFVRVIVFRLFAGMLGGLLVRLYPNGTWRTTQKSAHDVLAAAMDDGPLPLTERPKGLYLDGSELGSYNPEARDPDKGRVIWGGSLRYAHLKNGETILQNWQ